MASKVNDTPAWLLQLCLILLGICIAAANTDTTYTIARGDQQTTFEDISELQVSPLYDSSRSLLRVRRQATNPPSSNISTTIILPTASTTTKTSTVRTTTTTATTPTPRPTPKTPTTPSTPAPTPAPTPTGTSESVTIVQDVDHSYYTSVVVHGSESKTMWLDAAQVPAVKKHGSLSDSHRVAATVKLSFTFLFYGHPVSQVTIATGGFLYLSKFLHQWLTATQYIAPLMANFDTQIGNSSQILYADTGSYLVVWWQDVQLQDFADVGLFNFQTVIHKDGRVIFNYQQVPVQISTIPRAQHPVKIGLSDAYYMDTTTSANMKRRTIYEYHRVEIDSKKITNSSSVIIKPLPTCTEQPDCQACLTVNIGFKCEYCANAKHCSDGTDRKRQQWLHHKCDKQEAMLASECPKSSSGNVSPPMGHTKFAGGLGVGGIVGILIVLTLIILVVFLTLYAYFNPQTKLGLWLIEHRPSRLRHHLSNVRFFKGGDGNADKYEVTVQPDGGESIA